MNIGVEGGTTVLIYIFHLRNLKNKMKFCTIQKLFWKNKLIL